MKKLSAKDLVDFRRRSDRGRKNFVENVKLNKVPVPSDGGGDYWITSLSAVSNAYRENDLSLIDEKLIELETKLEGTKATITKNMYERNKVILQRYKDLDMKKLRPAGPLSFLKKSSANPVMTVKGIILEAKPTHFYTYGKKDDEKIGAIWFVAKVNGYTTAETVMFCEILYRFLKNNFAKKYAVNASNCIVVDMISNQVIKYAEIETGKYAGELMPTLDAISKLM